VSRRKPIRVAWIDAAFTAGPCLVSGPVLVRKELSSDLSERPRRDGLANDHVRATNKSNARRVLAALGCLYKPDEQAVHRTIITPFQHGCLVAV
jgi:hypothetical protein